MPCFHKFFGHPAHMAGENGLLPDWDADTLIIGTFNPELIWNPRNDAEYFYGRLRSYFWKILPRFACHAEIPRLDDVNQREFLIENRIALTDLLISINDANVHEPQHIRWIKRFIDNDLLNFHELNWNTANIIRYIQDEEIKAVYFTKMGGQAPFGAQMASIEEFCNQNNIINFRLHTPAAMGLGEGRPKKNKLIHRWYQQGGNQFPFLCTDFDLNNFPWQ